LEAFEPYLPLSPIQSGRGLIALVCPSAAMHSGFRELDNLEDAKAIEAFHEFAWTAGFGEDALLANMLAAETEKRLPSHRWENCLCRNSNGSTIIMPSVLG
jgi:hypothetical protein